MTAHVNIQIEAYGIDLHKDREIRVGVKTKEDAELLVAGILDWLEKQEVSDAVNSL